MLCPQPDCGMCMVFDPKQCAFTSRGPACAACTKKIRARHTRPLNYNNSKSHLYCLNCPYLKDGVHLKAEDAHIYPEGVVLCRKHHFAALQRHVEKNYVDSMNHQAVADLIIDYVNAWRQRNKDNSKQYLEYQRKQYKRSMTR
jgi:hypothetical protein